MRLPRLLVLLATVVLVAGLVISAVGAWRTGISWDESYHVMRLRNLLDHGWYLLDQDLDGDRAGGWASQRYVYGPVAALVLHAWTVLWGGETWGTVSASAHAYALRHLGVALIGAIGVGATGLLGRVVTGRRAGGLLAAAVLVSVPTWTGHAMFNVKDVPVACGYTLVTLSCALLLAGRTPRVLVALPLVTGLVLAIGTRPGIWPGLALAVGLTVLLRLRRPGDLAWLFGSGVAAYGLLLLAYPAIFRHPVATLIHSIGESADFGDKPGQWWYLPVFLVVELPTLWLIAGAVGAVFAVRRWRSPTLVLVLAQTFTLPVLAIAHRSNIYTGIRQFLFATPGLAVLATVALLVLLERRGAWRTWLAGAAFVVPMAGQAMLFPYVYAFESAPANLAVPLLARHDGALEVQTDYWRTSVRELAPQVPEGAFVTCSPELRDGTFWRHSNDTTDDCGSFLISPLAAYDDQRVLPWAGSPTEFVAVRQGNATIASNCTELGDVTRRLWWRKLTMSTVSRCELAVEPWPGAPIAFDGSGAGVRYLLGGWWLHPKNDAAILRPGTSGEVGVRAPHPGALDLTLTITGHPTLTVNGSPVTLDDQGRATVPAGIAAAWGGRLVLTLTAGTSASELRRISAS